MTEQEIFELQKWFISQNKLIQLEVWKNLGKDQEAEELRRRFVHTIKEIKTRIHRDRRKYLNRELGLTELAETTKLRILTIKQKPRRKPKKGTLLRKVKHHVRLVDQLRAEGLGWRKVAEYLRRYARLQISHNQLRLLHQKLKEEKQEQQRPDDQTKGREIIPTSDPKVVIRKKSN